MLVDEVSIIWEVGVWLGIVASSNVGGIAFEALETQFGLPKPNPSSSETNPISIKIGLGIQSLDPKRVSIALVPTGLVLGTVFVVGWIGFKQFPRTVS